MRVTGRTTRRLNRFDVDAEPLKRPADESPSCQFFLEGRMCLRAVLAVDDHAVATNAFGESLRTINCGASLREQLYAALRR